MWTRPQSRHESVRHEVVFCPKAVRCELLLFFSFLIRWNQRGGRACDNLINQDSTARKAAAYSKRAITIRSCLLIKAAHKLEHTNTCVQQHTNNGAQSAQTPYITHVPAHKQSNYSIESRRETEQSGGGK